MSKASDPVLIIIGGHEDKENEEVILKAFTGLIPDSKPLVVLTAATQNPDEMGETYTKAFKRIGVKNIEVLDIRSHDDAFSEANVEKIRSAGGIFFVGGDQLRITGVMGGSPVCNTMRELFDKAQLVIAGTSAGAAAMPQTMLVSGAGDQSSSISALNMAPGLGFIPDVVIDSHFAERGRIGRLLGAVVQNPRNLGIGIDEDTAIIVHSQHRFQVIGSGAVYVVDGWGVTYSSLSEQNPEGIITIHDVRLHVLGDGAEFNLQERRPVVPEEAKEA